MVAELFITDGTTRIDLHSSRRTGWYVQDWRPGVGRDVTERINLLGRGFSQDDMIRYRQELERLLIGAADYWNRFWDAPPVYIGCRAKCETNMRYALVREGRMPDDADPLNRPFAAQPWGWSAVNRITLELRRLDWTKNKPGENTCVQTSGQMQLSYPAYIEFNATTTDIDCLSAPAIDNLPAGANGFTAEAWVRSDGWGEGNLGRIFDKKDVAAAGWVFWNGNGTGLSAYFDCAVNDAWAYSGVDEWSPDGDWHHVVVQFEDTTRVVTLGIDGQEVQSYLERVNGGGAYAGDAANNLHIGNMTALTRTWDGDIGWTRTSDIQRYTFPYTVPPRCTMPTVDANTVTQHIGAELGGGTIDNAGSAGAAADGTLVNGVFHCDCYNGTVFGQEATCQKDVYVANKHVRAQVNLIYTESAANGFSVNLVGTATPWDLIDVAGAAPAVGDFVYFGVQTLWGGVPIANSGPFSSLVFDISTVISGMTVSDWEYSDGIATWANLTFQDNTWDGGAMTGGASTFDTAGVNSVHWLIPTSFAPEAVNGVTAYWVRARVTAAPGPAVAPEQGNRDVYTVTQPYIDIAAAQVGGDLDALVKTQQEMVSEILAPGPEEEDTASVHVLGIRDCARGEDFSAYINLADEQNPLGVSVSVTGGGAFVNKVKSPTGRALQFGPLGIGIVPTDRGYVDIEEGYAHQWAGTFRCFLRAHETVVTTVPGLDVFLSFRTGDDVSGYYREFHRTEAGNIVNTIDNQTMDMGQVTIPKELVAVENLRIAIMIGTFAGNGAGDITMYDLIFIPTDEWSGETKTSNWIEDPTYGICLNTGWQNVLDSLTDLRETKAYWSKVRLHPGAEQFLNRCRLTTASVPVLLANKKQRLWSYSYKLGRTDRFVGYSGITHRVQVHANQRYLSMRGAR